MGTTGNGPFECDAAADFLAELVECINCILTPESPDVSHQRAHAQRVRAARAVWLAMRRSAVPIEIPEAVDNSQLDALVTPTSSDLETRLLARTLDREAAEARRSDLVADVRRFASLGRNELARQFEMTGAPDALSEWIDEGGFASPDQVPTVLPFPEWNVYVALAGGANSDDLIRRFARAVAARIAVMGLGDEVRAAAHEVAEAAIVGGHQGLIDSNALLRLRGLIPKENRRGAEGVLFLVFSSLQQARSSRGVAIAVAAAVTRLRMDALGGIFGDPGVFACLRSDSALPP